MVSKPAGKRCKRDASEQAVEHATELAVACPLVLGAISDQHIPDRLARGQTIGLVEHTDRAARRRL